MKKRTTATAIVTKVKQIIEIDSVEAANIKCPEGLNGGLGYQTALEGNHPAVEINSYLV